MNNVWNRLLVFVFLAGIVAVYGLGLSHPKVINAQNDKNYWTNVSPDGWVVDGARLIFPKISSFGSKLVLRWENRRHDRATAKLEIISCDGAKRAVSVRPGQAETVVWFMGECGLQDPQLVINVLNPFKPISQVDTRALGVQLESVRVTSPFKVPLFNFKVLLSVFLMLMLLLELSWIAGGAVPAIAVAIGSCALLYGNNAYLDLTKQTSLAIFFSSLLLGVVLSRKCSAGKNLIRLEERIWTVQDIALIVGVVIVAATLRIWGISFGLPYNYHPDEVPKVNAVGRMIASGTLDPDYFLHPSILLYCAYGMMKVLALLPHPESFETRTLIVLGGRLTSAIAGVGSVFLLALIGRNLFSRRAGIVAAAVLAVLPLHVTCSRYMKEDSLLVVMTLLTLYVVTEAVRKNSFSLLWLSSFIAGLSASSKYSGMLNVVLVLSAPWLRSSTFIPDRAWLLMSLKSLILMPFGFLLGTPYSVINTDRFLLHFNSERLHMMKGHTVVVTPWSELWMFHYGKSILPGATLITGILMTIACGYLVWEFTIPSLLVVALVGMYYGPAEFVNAKPPPQPERYILPCLPFMALAFGGFLSRVQASKKTLLVLSAVAFISPALRSFELARDITYDTRAKMADYIVKNVPAGSKIYLDYPRYAPYLPEGMYQIDFLYGSGLAEKIPVASLRTSGFNYMVLSSLTYDRYFMNDATNVGPIRGLFRSVFTKVPMVKHLTAPSGTYGFNNPALTLFELHDPKKFDRLESEVHERIKGKIAKTSNDLIAPELPKIYPF